MPLTIELSPGSRLHLLSRQNEARYLLNALAGMTNLQEGRVSYGGTMNYSPSKPWLMKDTVKQNVAEIIIAKHRNGPVGSVELVFRGALAKFENAATRVFKPNE